MLQKLRKLERESLDVSLLQSRLTEFEQKLIEKTAELETREREHLKREGRLTNENRRLSQHINSLQKRANQLAAFRRAVEDTIRKDDDFVLPDDASGEKNANSSSNENIPAAVASHRSNYGIQGSPGGMQQHHSSQ